MASEKQHHTFISYSRVDEQFAEKFAKDLKTAGFSIWFDQLDIPTGARWDDEIEKALRECAIFMVILTPASIMSDNAKDEIGYAIDHDKRIIPVLLEDCEIPLRLRRFQYVDFTRMNFNQGVEAAKELLAKLIEEESIPAPARSKERPTQPSTTRSSRAKSGHGMAVTAEHSMGSKKQSATKMISIFAGIAGVAILILVLILNGNFFREIAFSTQESTSISPTREVTSTDTSVPTAILATPTSQPERFYTEEFDQNIDTWKFFIKNGDENEFETGLANGKLVVRIDLLDGRRDQPWAYFINGDYSYTDVRLDVAIANKGNNSNGVSLVCRYGGHGWYEFWISNDGTYAIYAFGPGGEIPSQGNELFKGGSSDITTGENVYTGICKGNELSLYVNGMPVKTIDAKYNYPEGNIALGFSSPRNLPVDIEFESVKISQP